MASRRFDPSGRASGGAPTHHYRIVVVAPAVGALVESAGGFLCDRAREGWDVAVALSVTGDARPLNILGVPLHEPVDDLASVIGGLARGTTLAVGADLLSGDTAARQALARFAGRGLGTVTVWGRPSPSEIERGLEPAPHTLSAAAKAFKASAMRAAELEGGADAVESLHRLRGGSFRRLYAV